MRYLILLIITQMAFGQKKIYPMKLNLDKYKNWEVDSVNYFPNKDHKHLFNGDNKVSIRFSSDRIKIIESNIKKPHKYYMFYDLKTKELQITGQIFYDMRIGIFKDYKGLGTLRDYKDGKVVKVVKEVNYDELYPLSIDMLRKKMLELLDVDIFDQKKIQTISRYVSPMGFKSFYQLNLECDLFIDSYLIDGITGDILFNTHTSFSEPYYIRDLYKKSLESKTKIYKTYKGKDYTKEEWKIFEEKEYEIYKKSRK